MPTFADHLTRERGLSDATARAYVIDMGLFASWYQQTNGERFEHMFTPTDVREYKAHLITVDKAAPATINRKLASLRAWGNYLVDTGKSEYNPAAAARGVKEQPAAPKWLDGKEQARLARAMEKEVLAARTDPAKREAARNQAIVTMLLHTGLRVGELCALDLSDVIMGERSGTVTVRLGKGDKYRDLPLNLTVRQALKAWMAVYPKTNTRALFIGRTGERLEPRGVQKMIADVARQANVDELTPHTLRHTFAKNLINGGVGMEKVAALMGHSSLDTTALYIVPDARDLARAVQTLED